VAAVVKKVAFKFFVHTSKKFQSPIFAAAGLTRPAPAEPSQGRKAARVGG